MSAPLAGKFQDHYEVLGVEPRADLEDIQRAYAMLAQEYHPKTPITGNKEKFDAVNLAYEVLSDPTLRNEFDKVKGVTIEDDGAPKFSGVNFFPALARDFAIRSALLCVLYDRRRTKPFRPSLSVRHIEAIVAASGDELTLALWYLKQRGLAASDDKSSIQITVEGMDFLEVNMPAPELVMPFIKLVAQTAAEPAQPAPAQEEPIERSPEPKPVAQESLRNMLNRNIARQTANKVSAN